MTGIRSGWTRSSKCDTGTCVEVRWQRSKRCDTGNCVEVGESDGEILVRDSKNPDGPRLQFTPDEWTAFIAGVKADEFQFS